MTTQIAQTGDTIDILLATYNGAAFLEEQLDSIVTQTRPDWRLIARDDGSTDRTPEILQAFRERHPDKVVMLEDGDGNLGLVQNFSRLMEHSTAPYAAFCDQDDVWIPEKLELSLAKMRELEREQGAETPLLVFTDLEVVDEDLKVINSSSWHFANLRPDRCNSLNRLLLQNVVTGCTVLMNRPLVGKAVPIPSDAHVHDWWVALAASTFGRAAYVSRRTVRYRQHDRNLLGASPGTLFVHLIRLPIYLFEIVFEHEHGRCRVQKMYRQGAAFYRRYRDHLEDDVQRDLAVFVDIPKRSLVARFRTLQKFAFLPIGFFNSVRHILYSHE